MVEQVALNHKVVGSNPSGPITFKTTKIQIHFMNIKKAIISGVILYALIFLLASALLFVVPNESVFGSIIVVIVAILTYLIAKNYYFKGMKISNPIKEGLILGIILVIIIIIIEIPVMVYGFAVEQGWNYFTTWHILLGYILTVVVPIFAAYKKK